MVNTPIEDVIGKICSGSFGVLDSEFLCRSVGTLNPHPPICIRPEATLAEAVQLLQDHQIGVVLVTDEAEKVAGIFSERDLVCKVLRQKLPFEAIQVKHFMTPNPMCVEPNSTIAYALNLMSQGGFRHLPVIDDNDLPIGMLSVKNVMDFIVQSFLNDLTHCT